MNTAVAPARFAPDPHRRALIGKVKLAQKALGMVEDDYRQMLLRVGGAPSAADLDVPALAKVVEEMKRLGFKPLPRAGTPKRPAAADHPSARKARAMWISLHQLGAIENASEQALEAFARRQLGVARMQWADQALMYKLVEALKAIAERAGWSQDLAGVPVENKVRVLKLRLVEALLAKLKATGMVPAEWSLAQAAFRLLGMPEQLPTFWDLGEIDLLAKGLAEKLK